MWPRSMRTSHLGRSCHANLEQQSLSDGCGTCQREPTTIQSLSQFATSAAWARPRMHNTDGLMEAGHPSTVDQSVLSVGQPEKLSLAEEAGTAATMWKSHCWYICLRRRSWNEFALRQSRSSDVGITRGHEHGRTQSKAADCEPHDNATSPY